jgi:dipeptidyl aminopeptidase/acylaminoacyl peptidase
LTFDGRSAQPRWSPDGSALAFVRRAEGAKPQLHVLPLAGGEARALTKLEKGVASPAWSPDGKAIAFLSGHDPERDVEGAKKPKHEPARVVTRPEFRWNNEGFTDFEHLDHVWVVNVDAGEPRRLTKGMRCKEWSPAWSRDGKSVLFATDRREAPWHSAPAEDNDIRAVAADLDVPTEGETMRVVADITGPIAQFVEGADGRIAAVGGIRPQKPNTYEANDLLLFEGAWPQLSPRVLTERVDLHVGEGVNSDQHPPRGGGELPLGFAAGGKAIVFAHARRGAAHLALCDVASGRVEDLTGPDLEVIAGTVSADGRRVALTAGSLTSPGDLHVYDLERRTLTRLWGANDELLAGPSWARSSASTTRRSTARRSRPGSSSPPISTRRRSTRSCSRSTAARTRRTASASSTSSACSRPRAISCSTPTRAAARATARSSPTASSTHSPATITKT